MSEVKTATKAEVAYELVRDQLLRGDLVPGSVIQQAALARDLGISTTPLREALRRLMTEGLVELDAHRDARVTRLTAEEARDLVEILPGTALRRQAGRQRVERTADLDQIARLLRGQPGDARVPVRVQLDQALGHQPAQRLAQGCRADPELAGQVGLRDDRTGSEPATQHLVADEFVGDLGLGHGILQLVITTGWLRIP